MREGGSRAAHHNQLKVAATAAVVEEARHIPDFCGIDVDAQACLT